MAPFDPNAAARPDSGVFGLPYSPEESRVVLLPVPWEATTSYGGGTASGPRAILAASRQVDLFDLELGRAYEAGIAMLPEPPAIVAWNIEARARALEVIEAGGVVEGDEHLATALALVNSASEKVNDAVLAEASAWFDAGKIVGVVGGDHSSPFGAIQACGAAYRKFGILHLDAHSDTRRAYEGFVHSHASIMDNVLREVPQVTRLVQVGVRDLCEEEHDRVASQPERVSVHWDLRLYEEKANGTPWARLLERIVGELPELVWLSFDIDGLDPALCPHTGTPVPGGLSFHEARSLIRAVARSGRRIVGFDLCEVAPGPAGDEWDANVGARLLYQMALGAIVSNPLKP